MSALTSPTIFQTAERGQLGTDAHGRSAPLSPISGEGHDSREAQGQAALPGQSLDGGQPPGVSQSSRASVETDLPARGHRAHDTQDTRAAGGNLLRDAQLGILSDTLDGLEELRTATSNRLRILLTPADQLDADGLARGFGYTEEHPTVRSTIALRDSLADLEKRAVRDLEKHLKRHPLWPVIRDERGVGAKQGARLLAAIGDPYWNDLHDRPRTVSELWAYCGYSVIGGAAQRRKKGVRSNWSTVAKTRAFLVAEAVVKASVRVLDKDAAATEEGYNPDNREALSALGQLYLDRRRATADREHAVACVRCGPAGKPAEPGTLWKPSHQQSDAIRVVAKEVLKLLWIAARDFEDRA